MNTRRRNVSLDALRGVAVLLVCGHHMDTVPLPTGWLRAFAACWYEQGGIGVDLFFVLSGFLVSGLLFDEFTSRRDLHIGRFLVRRGLKLYPAYFAFLGYLLLRPVASALWAGEGWTSVLGRRAMELLPSALFVQNYWWNEATTPLHTWSIAVEEHFYLVIPFLLLALLRAGRVRWLLWIWVLCEAASIWLRTVPGPWFGPTHIRFSELLAGVLLRSFLFLYPSWREGQRRFAWPLVAAAVGTYAVVLSGPAVWLRIPMLELAAAAMVAGTLDLDASRFHPWLLRLAVLPRCLAGIGYRSYSIYLWHVTSMRIAERWLVAHVGLPTTSWSWLLCSLFACGAAVLVGVVMSHLVEYPVLRLRDRWWPPQPPRLAQP